MFISIAMPAYNAERYLREAMDSVLRQTYPEFELIVVDDGSTDGTPEILDHYQQLDQRVRVVSHENWRIVRSLNDAIEKARSSWIVRMDADDVMMPDRLLRQVKFLKENPDLGLTSCLVEYIDQDGKLIGRSHSDLLTDAAVERSRERGELIIMSHPGSVFRKDAFESVGGYREETWPGEDVDLFNRIADAGYRVLVQPEYLLRYRIHAESATGETLKMDGTLQTWLQDSSLRRRAGLPELSQEQFVQFKKSQPLLKRFNDRRKDQASMFYRRATFSYSLGTKGQTVLLVVASSLLDPTNAPVQIWRKFVTPRLNR